MKLRHICSSLVLAGGLLVLSTPSLLHAAQEGSVASSKVSTPKQQKIRKLMVLMGTQELMVQGMNQMIAQFKNNPKIPEDFLKEFQKRVVVEDLITLLVPVYDKNINEEDLDAMIKFYESSAGKNLVKSMPAIQKESMTIGQEWGKKIGEQAQQEIQKRAPKAK